MRTIKVYSFDELSDKAKETAINEMRLNDNPWESENLDSLKVFSKLFNLRLSNNGFDPSNQAENLQGIRLSTWLWNNYRKELFKPVQYWICNGLINAVGIGAKHRNSNISITPFNCSMTGYWMDNEILKPIIHFMNKPNNSDFNDLMNECFNAYLSACDKDFEFQTADDSTIEMIKANDYEFDQEGNLV